MSPSHAAPRAAAVLALLLVAELAAAAGTDAGRAPSISSLHRGAPSISSRHRGAPSISTSHRGAPSISSRHRGVPAVASRSAARTALARMVGQMIVTRFSGTRPTVTLLRRVRRGEVGGVILFADNIVSARATRALVSRLQQVARAGGNPPLLITADQEGGEVKRLSWAPPALAPAAMRTTAIARAEGRATARALRAVGVNVDLAPVADVERVSGSFLGSRSFGSAPAIVGARACAFAKGLAEGGVAYTLKHFPGLGRALTSTDVQPTVVDASRAQLQEDYQAYARCDRGARALVMVASAIYPRLSGRPVPAVLSPQIYRTELPLATGGASPVTISDDLQAPALAGEPNTAVRAVNAGLDLLLYARSEAGSIVAHRELMQAARSGALVRAEVQAASEAIAALKRTLASNAPSRAGSASPTPQAR